jgi:hypothetical protein
MNLLSFWKRKASVLSKKRDQLKPGWDKLVRVDYHATKEVPSGTLQSILKAAGLK